MRAVVDCHDLAAGLLLYPGADYHERVRRCRAEFAAELPGSADFLAAFAEAIAGLRLEEIEEAIRGTFDLNPTCALEVGWHLFGENYARGDFLVKMRAAIRRLGLPESTELPDHLAYVLAVLGRLPPAESGPFAAGHVLPSLDKMLASFADQENPYERLLQVARCLAASHVSPAAAEVDHG